MRVATKTRLSPEMYKRPNAPFKPPRPANLNTGKSNSPSNEKQNLLFVPESDAPSVELPAKQSVKKHASLAPTPSLKRVRPNPKLVRKFANPAVQSRTTLLSKSDSRSDASGDDSALQDGTSGEQKKYYSVQWRKRSNKKNKSWEGDGFIVVTDSGITLRIELGDGAYKLVGRTKKTDTEGVFSIGVHEVEIDCETTRENIFGKAEGENADPSPPTASLQPSVNTSFRKHSVKREEPEDETPETIEVPETVEEPEKTEVPRKSEVSQTTTTSLSHGQLVLPLPNAEHSTSVIVDDKLTRFLRQHQREGVIFLYSCLMGMRNNDHFGALLADEMGLGKTLMTISVIWTLLKQSPVPTERSVVNKVLICCPVSLIDNWRREFGKWLDLNRIGILALNNKNLSSTKDKQDIVSFGKTKVYQVLIMNYEKVLSCTSELSTVGIDLLVCDEGHRLKSSANKVLKFLNALPVKRRLVLTGTPIQNDLNEFYNIANFINPGLLGTMADFQKDFLKPILRARDVNCFDPAIAEKGKETSAALIEITKSFTIRRTKAVIEEFLTAKTDILIFCPPTKLQKQLFQFVIKSMGFSSLVNSASREVLPTINLLRKVCNSPSLLAEDASYKSAIAKNRDVSPDFLPLSLSARTTGSKMNVAIPLLLHFRNQGENAVLVSNFTQTLDLLERVLLKLNFLYARLDGSTPLATRDALVNSFNKTKKYQVFLLSAKAGGVGLNLIGASRLVLFDNDWNPSVDLQAMARIHRDGQKRAVFIYRLFTTGSIDEKIFQRQLMKNNLSDMFLDDNVELNLNIFDYEDLKDLFTVVESTCNTHDLIDCDCRGTGEKIDLSKDLLETRKSAHSSLDPASSQAHRTSSSGYMSALEYKSIDQSDSAKKQTIRSALSHYRHFDPIRFDSNIDSGDAVLNALVPKADGDISYIFTHQKEPAAEGVE